MLDLKERPDHPFVHFCIGMEYHYNHEHEQAIQHLIRSIKLSGSGDTILRKTWALLAGSLEALGKIDDALEAYRKGIVAVGNDPDLCFGRAKLLDALGRKEEAIANYFRATQADISEHFSSFDIGIVNYKSYHNLGNIFLELGRYDEAREVWQKAMQANLSEIGSALPLFQAALQQKDYATAKECKDRIFHVAGLGESFCVAEANWLNSIQGPGAGLVALQQIAQTHQTEGSMLVLCRELLGRGMEREAVPWLLRLNELDVAEAAFLLGSIETQQGNHEAALAWMHRAQHLNPDHEPTARLVAALESRTLAPGPDPPRLMS